MFSLNESIRYYLYPSPTDMRKGFYTLSGIVQNQMGLDVPDGDAFIFINRQLDSMKILHMETGGLVIYHMKLEAGRFRLPCFDMESGRSNHPTSWQELILTVQGISLPECHRKLRWKPGNRKK
ncbi:MAG: IS66 family insertion sequence element accessory protein TnpB [Tannerella sp.]|jgi:hypothetical protein|nr:IS66 family insertion sequence element accessory protein TnpB [Tannerella sp.]